MGRDRPAGEHQGGVKQGAVIAGATDLGFTRDRQIYAQVGQARLACDEAIAVRMASWAGDCFASLAMTHEPLSESPRPAYSDAKESRP
ncbi:MAG: hypothetical protein QOK01_1149 [Alphaproteobacteria bacterium]|nr:hypothetical protein [Alphaproteobacteria bacterium]